MNFRILLPSVFVLLLSFLFVPAASAHSTQPRVEISRERLNPGEVIDVRGVSFDMDEPVTLTLLASGVEIPLGEILSNGEGDFLQIVVLPADLAAGTYYFRATTNHHWVISPPLTVWGTAAIEGGGQGPRDDHDGLLAPMPTVDPAQPAPQPTKSSAAPTEPDRAGASMVNILIVALIAVVVVISGVAIGRRNIR